MKEKQCKISIHQIIWYIIIFSVIGLIIETIFCYVTTGIIESRKGLVWGPFCPVYGVGATILIIILNSYKDNSLKIFLLGAIIGNIIEYFLSYILEAMYGTRFWDYSFIPSNLNGRICLIYSVFWGILSIILVKYMKTLVDNLIEKIPKDKRIEINNIIIFLFIIDCLATVWAINAYQNRIVNSYNNTENNLIKKIEEKIFPNEFMMKTFPNLRYIDEQGNEYYIKELLKK